MMANPTQSNNTKRIQLRPVKSASKQNGKSHSSALATRTHHPPPNSNLSIGAPKGSQNFRNGMLVKKAFIRALRKRSRSDTLEELDRIATTIIKLAVKGHIPAARELFDRIDGKAAQLIVGDPDNPVFFKNVSEMSDEELEVVARGHVINGTAERVD